MTAETLQYGDWDSFYDTEDWLAKISSDDEFLPACVKMLRIERHYKEHTLGDTTSLVALRRELEEIPSYDFKIAALEFLRRKLKGVKFPMTTAEKAFFDDYDAATR
jgi:hypothetical protein